MSSGAEFLVGNYYEVVGLGVMDGDETCTATSTQPTGYVRHPDWDEMIPVNLNYFGEGEVGEFAVYLGYDKKRHSLSYEM
ncbi:hypothetical protein PBI_SCTP2_485 [Salicola phage SCTP-2]|nr:hypothetical protein PBI_SCTP2_485 [Salicola phage SCTP-2]